MSSRTEPPEWVMPWWVPLACLLSLLLCSAAVCFVWIFTGLGPLGPSN